jgi:cyclopropane fatty-acyl-phospholipid synthase-like methyltransferase
MTGGLGSLTRPRTIELERSFYDRHWRSTGAASHARERKRIDLTTSALPPGVNQILDVGCGDGRLSKAIRKKRDCFLVGYDLSTTALGRLRVGCTNALPESVV